MILETSEISRDEARAIIENIRVRNGGISQADRDRTPAAVLNALESVRSKLGASTKTLATNIYSKDTRFVFELIQNAEDNKYTLAWAAGDVAYIGFNVSPDTVYVDSNEDGFSKEDVESICSTGQSSKTSKGYIGEKGIGFKSVFKIASQVHIQSGPFSFSFEHKRDDNGLGMVTPEYRDHEELPESVRTRMILSLADPSEFDQRVADILELPDTLLLFLTKLEKISININRPNEPVSKIVYSWERKEESSVVHLTKATGVEGHFQKSTNHYHIATRLLQGLPEDGTRKHTDEAKVILAFPIDSDSVPVIQQQYVFAYLPLRRVGFSFLIQSDFITQANREDVVRSNRNKAILDGVAQTFRDAVLEFCELPSLQYQWLKYLPGRSISDEFWAELLPKILTLLKETKVLRSRTQGVLKRPKDLRYLPADYLDQHNEPLFHDLADEIYLSSRYERISQLRELGVPNITYEEFFERLRADAKRTDSRMAAVPNDDDWHTRVAKLLTKAFEQGSPWTQQLLRGLQVIPLQAGPLVSSNVGRIFFPDNDGVPIPTDLNQRLVNANAIRNQSRTQLFSKLGVARCDPEHVVDWIHRRYNEDGKVRLECSVAHLRYLYWHLPTDKTNLYKRIYLYDRDSLAIYRYSLGASESDRLVDDLYFESNDEYGVQQLLCTEDSSKNSNVSIRFLNPAYLKAVADDARWNDRSWKSWLGEVAGVSSIPRLICSFDPSRLSKIFSYLVDKRPDKLIGTLRAHWSSYSSLMLPEISNALSNALVPCENLKKISLRRTYLPSLELKTRCEQFGVEKSMSFLRLPGHLGERPDQQWKFLEIFHVGTELDIRLYLDILQCLVHGIPKAEYRESLFNVYRALEENSKAVDYESIRRVFNNQKLIFVPTQGSQTATWSLSKDCVWNAPTFLRVKYPLASAKLYQGSDVLTRLFRSIILVPDASHMDYIHELERIRSSDSVNSSEVEEIYIRLWRMRDDKEVWDSVVRYFEVSLLIYVLPQCKWFSTSSCLWTEATRISGMVGISTQYLVLQDFFRELGVKAPNIDMFIQELEVLANGELPSIDDVKHFIYEINMREPQNATLRELEFLDILPVKHAGGQVTLRSTSYDFSVVDRHEHGKAFQGMIPILDFSLEEVHELQPILLALGLQGRYTSKRVEERSTVEGGIRDPDLTEQFRQKANALFRCAVHYRSHKVQDGDRSLHEVLFATDIYQSDGFSKSLILFQGGRRITVKSGKANLHIREGNKHLNIYVPRDNTARERCYLSQLPQRLFEYLAISDLAGKQILTAVLTGSQAVLDGLLEDSGIVEVPDLEPCRTASSQQEEELEYQTGETGTAKPNFALQQRATPPTESLGSPTNGPTVVPAILSPNSLDQGSTTSSFGSNSTFTFTYEPPAPTSFTVHPVALTASPGPPTSPVILEEAPRVVDSTDEYRTLLDGVINAASRASFPSRSLFDPKGLLHVGHSGLRMGRTRATLLNSVFGDRSQNQPMHDRKIGAAGELFIFEMLLRLKLPAFAIANWKSTIRKEVQIHAKYSNMEAWNGAETADLTYNDVEGNFTRLLIDKGYLPSAPWQQARPKYYLEVKTTTKHCSTRFFVSGSQYQRIQKTALTEGEAASEVYMILRVYNLGQEDIGLHIYFDPETLRRKNDLKFTPESYSVGPTGSARI